jgi:ribonuclease-3
VADRSSLAELVTALPDDLRAQALTHSSWAGDRAESYGRLAFLGDSVLGLAIAEELYRRFPRSDIGRLTKVHGQAVSGRACAEVAEVLGVPTMLREASSKASEPGIEPTAAATVAAFEPEIELASETLLDFKSALQEELARAGSTVSYAVVNETGPAHERRFEVEATANGEVLGAGSGRSKKAAEQAAAQEALERVTK